MAYKVDKKKVTYYLSPGLIKELRHHAVEEERSQSDIVEEAIRCYLEDFKKTRQSKRKDAV